MPGGRGKAVRSCPMCKPHKFAGNSEAALKHSVHVMLDESEVPRKNRRKNTKKWCKGIVGRSHVWEIVEKRPGRRVVGFVERCTLCGKERNPFNVWIMPKPDWVRKTMVIRNR